MIRAQKGSLLALVFIILGGTAIFIGEAYLEQQLTNKLKIQTKQGNTLSVYQVDLGLLSRSLTLSKLSINWVLNQKNRSDSLNSYLVRGNIDRIQLKGIIVMFEQNPTNEKYRVGQIYFERSPSRSFWNFYVKSLLSGLSSTAIPNLLLPKELDATKEKK